MKRRRKGVVVDPSALSRKQARRKAEEKLKTVALQWDPERLNGSLNVSSPHRSNVSSFPFVGRGGLLLRSESFPRRRNKSGSR